jgi:hypothetical protein
MHRDICRLDTSHRWKARPKGTNRLPQDFLIRVEIPQAGRVDARHPTRHARHLTRQRRRRAAPTPVRHHSPFSPSTGDVVADCAGIAMARITATRHSPVRDEG